MRAGIQFLENNNFPEMQQMWKFTKTLVDKFSFLYGNLLSRWPLSSEASVCACLTGNRTNVDSFQRQEKIISFWYGNLLLSWPLYSKAAVYACLQRREDIYWMTPIQWQRFQEWSQICLFFFSIDICFFACLIEEEKIDQKCNKYGHLQRREKIRFHFGTEIFYWADLCPITSVCAWLLRREDIYKMNPTQWQWL